MRKSVVFFDTEVGVKDNKIYDFTNLYFFIEDGS